MTRLRVLHQTDYAYDTPAKGVIQHLRLTPQSHDGQHVVRWRIETSVEGRLVSHVDGLGNVVHIFSPDEPVRDLRITASGEVATSDTAGVVRQAVERIPDPFFLRDTALTLADEAIVSLARKVADEGADVLDVLHRLLPAVSTAIRFDPAATVSTTTAGEALATGRGVCQDFAHIFVAAARHLGIPARYVSGYLNRTDGQVEQAATHAWAEAKVPGLGWVGFDPANDICVTENHVRVAVGLDYLGAAPVRGSRLGGGREGLAIRVRVEEGSKQGQAQRQG